MICNRYMIDWIEQSTLYLTNSNAALQWLLIIAGDLIEGLSKDQPCEYCEHKYINFKEYCWHKTKKDDKKGLWRWSYWMKVMMKLWQWYVWTDKLDIVMSYVLQFETLKDYDWSIQKKLFYLKLKIKTYEQCLYTNPYIEKKALISEWVLTMKTFQGEQVQTV